MTWAGSSSDYSPLNPQIFFSPCLQGIVSLFLLPQFYSYLPPWQYLHRSLSWNLNDPWRQLDFIKELMESLGVSSLSYLVFHLVGWKESSQLPGSHMLGKLPAVELRLEESHFLNSSVPHKSLQSMGIYKYSHIARSSAIRVLLACQRSSCGRNTEMAWISNVPWSCTFLVVKGLQGLFHPAPH